MSKWLAVWWGKMMAQLTIQAKLKEEKQVGPWIVPDTIMMLQIILLRICDDESTHVEQRYERLL